MKLALIGHNISYSLSPRIFESFFRRTGIAGQFRTIDIEPSQWKDTLDWIKDTTDAFFVTQPFKGKLAATPWIRTTDVEISEVANVAYQSESGWKLLNTDIFGLQYGFPWEHLCRDGSLCILGTGSVVRSSLLALTKLLACPLHICILGRNENSICELIQKFQPYTHHLLTQKLGDGPISVLHATSSPCDMSQWPALNSVPIRQVCDVNYHTPGIGIDGRAMLILQAAQAFSIISGVPLLTPDWAPMLEELLCNLPWQENPTAPVSWELFRGYHPT